VHPSRIALVVEDDPALQDAMRNHLQAMQFRVLTSFDYRGAVRHLETDVPDVACIDLGLPSESGYEVCEHIRGKPALANVPVILTSERTFPEDMARAEEAGANAFLRKPFSMAQLTETIEMLLGHEPASRRWARRLRWT
jgi:twitching motility two-component system response regulator PilG